jgi:hypothetical protein
MDFAFRFQLSELIFVKHFAIEKQASNQSTFSVIDASTRDESEQFLLFVLFEICQNVFGNEVALV